MKNKTKTEDKNIKFIMDTKRKFISLIEQK